MVLGQVFRKKLLNIAFKSITWLINGWYDEDDEWVNKWMKERKIIDEWDERLRENIRMIVWMDGWTY